MGGRGLLIDSDIFLVLAGADLLERTLELLQLDPANVFRLQPLPSMIERSRTIRRDYPESVRRKARAACDESASFTERPRAEWLELLSDVPEIDPGESLLYAALVERPMFLLASGDNRAMRSVGTVPTLAGVRDAIQGRVICLEYVLRLLIENEGVPAVAKKLSPMIQRHKTLRIVFSPHNVSHPDQAMEALDSFLNDLRRNTGGILFGV